MPLKEISVNEHRHGGRSQSATPASDSGGTRKMKPDVVSGMLKTSTEVGNVGYVAVPSHRPPRSASRLSNQSGSVRPNTPTSTSKASQRRQLLESDVHIPKHSASLSTLARHGTVQSSSSFYRSIPRMRSRDMAGHHHGQGRGAISSFSPGPYHYSLDENRRDRMTSPAFSDARSVPAYSGDSTLRGAPNRTTDASSPFPACRAYHSGPYRRWNHSTSSLGRLPSPAMPGAFPRSRRSSVSSRYATSGSMSPHMSACPNSSAGSFRTAQHSVNRSRTPQYYDYTEAFAEEDIQIQEHGAAAHTFGRPDPAGGGLSFSGMREPSFDSRHLPTQQDRSQNERTQQHPIGSLQSGSLHRGGSFGTAVSPDISDEKQGSSLDLTYSEASLPKSTRTPVPAEGSSEATQGLPRAIGADPRRCSGLSYRTCPLSPSTLFFPNANRSSRDLTGLAARVHHSTPNSTHTDDIKSTVQQSTGTTDSGSDSGHEWQFPALDLKALSSSYHSHGALESQGSIGQPAWSNAPDIVCPTPERPTSAESRRKFSRILDLDDSNCMSCKKSSCLSDPSSGVAHTKTKSAVDPIDMQVADLTPPVSAGEATNVKSNNDDDESNVESTYQRSERGRKISTPELRFDQHIDVQSVSQDLIAKGKGGSDDDNQQNRGMQSITGYSGLSKPTGPSRHQAQTSGVDGAQKSSMTSSDQQELAPRRLFFYNKNCATNFGAAHSTPCISQKLVKAPLRTPSDRSLGQDAQEGGFPYHRLQASKTQISPLLRTSSRARSSKDSSKGSGDAAIWNKDEIHSPAQISRRCRPDVMAWRSSQRQRAKSRLKHKRNSQIQSQPVAGILASVDGSSDPPPFLLQNEVASQHPISGQVGRATQLCPTLDDNTVTTIQGIQDSDIDQRDPLSATPSQQFGDLASDGLISRGDLSAPRSRLLHNTETRGRNANFNQGIQGTGWKASRPYLAIPGLGTPLSSTSLNGDVVCPRSGIPAGPNLRSMQSFFSDDSSAKQQSRVSLRKRLKLPSLRHGSGPLLRAQTVTPGAGNTSQYRSPHIRRKRGSQLAEDEHDGSGVVSVSNSRHCRRKVAGKFKYWLQKKFAHKKTGREQDG